MILVDSDILIWILRGNESIKNKFLRLVDEFGPKLYITPIQIAEIFTGLRETEKIDTALFLDSFPCLVIDDKIGKLAGEFLQIYTKSHRITLADAIIGSCAKSFSLKLWTLNKKHYPMISVSDFLD